MGKEKKDVCERHVKGGRGGNIILKGIIILNNGRLDGVFQRNDMVAPHTLPNFSPAVALSAIIGGKALCFEENGSEERHECDCDDSSSGKHRNLWHPFLPLH